MRPEPGRLIADRYRVETPLGQGGMGEVWSCRDLTTGGQVALKFITFALLNRMETRKRFQREARLVGAIAHPNVVPVLDVLEAEGAPVLVMPQLNGETLRARLDRQGQLPVPVAARLFSQVVSALGACHAQGIVHRDLKPDNIFVTAEEQAVVLDFGIAKCLAELGLAETLTHSNAILGTPCYMAPEQGFGERDIDHRADIWSIGAMLYEALGGGRPVDGENLGQVLKRFLTEGVTPLSALEPELPEPLCDLVMTMLAVQRDRRPADLRPVQRALEIYTAERCPGFGAPDISAMLPPGYTPAPAAHPVAAESSLFSAEISARSPEKPGWLGRWRALIFPGMLVGLWFGLGAGQPEAPRVSAPRSEALVAPKSKPAAPSMTPPALDPHPEVGGGKSASVHPPEAGTTRAHARAGRGHTVSPSTRIRTGHSPGQPTPHSAAPPSPAPPATQVSAADAPRPEPVTSPTAKRRVVSSTADGIQEEPPF